MARNNYRKAGITLGITTVGFLMSYPFHNAFWGGLISGGCRAAMVGGLADWFAVTALFRRPLGIRPGRVIRTEIIPRNRERIFTALADMVQNELLSPQALQKRLEAYNIAQMIVRYLTEHGGKEDVNTILAYLVEDALDKLEPEGLGQLTGQVVEQGGQSLQAAPVLAKLIRFSLERGYDEKVLDFLLDQLIELVKHPQAAAIIFQLIKEAMETYEKGMDRRRFVNGLLLQLSPLSLAELAQAKLIEGLEGIRFSHHHPFREKLRSQVVTALGRVENDPGIQQKLETWKNQNLRKLNLGAEISRLLTNKQEIPLEQITVRLQTELAGLMEEFGNNPAQQLSLDKFIKRSLVSWLDTGNREIGSLVRDNLDRFSNQLLVELIEEKAGNDLQMIRINGTVVGGLVGMLIYLLTYWLG